LIQVGPVGTRSGTSADALGRKNRFSYSMRSSVLVIDRANDVVAGLVLRRMFWTLWAVNAVIGAIVLFFFFWGLADGSVSSFNIGLWTTMLAALAVVIGGSLWLKSSGRRRLGVSLLMVFALPGLLYAAFLVVVIASGESWN
jgi:hypothetical protein